MIILWLFDDNLLSFDFNENLMNFFSLIHKWFNESYSWFLAFVVKSPLSSVKIADKFPNIYINWKLTLLMFFLIFVSMKTFFAFFLIFSESDIIVNDSSSLSSSCISDCRWIAAMNLIRLNDFEYQLESFLSLKWMLQLSS